MAKKVYTELPVNKIYLCDKMRDILIERYSALSPSAAIQIPQSAYNDLSHFLAGVKAADRNLTQDCDMILAIIGKDPEYFKIGLEE